MRYSSYATYIIAILGIHFCTQLHGHEVRPAFLEIKEVSELTYKIKWKVPLLNNRVPDILPVFEAGTLTEDSAVPSSQAFIRTFTLSCNNPLGGTELYIQLLDATLIDVLVQLEHLSGEINTLLIQPSEPRTMIPLTTSRWQAVKTFLVLGVEHILFGWDHLLFVLGLLLLIKGLKPLLFTITAFTLAHSFTLVLAALGAVSLPGAPVEAVIALSVIFLAREYVMLHKGARSITQEQPWLVAFIFGLLHGFGFAGALGDIGLPQHALASSLFSFNIGVEVGQVFFVGCLILVYRILQKMNFMKISRQIKLIPGYAIGGIASFWFVTRLLDIVL